MKLDELTKDELKELVQIYARNIFALDGVWFQSVENEKGMDVAMYHDGRAWQRFAEIEARRIKSLLHLTEYPGLEGLQQALSLRFSALGNRSVSFINNGQSLIYRIIDCRVQSARHRKGMVYHPCKSVGYIENAFFAKTIDKRIICKTLSCYPDIMDESCACAWQFTIVSDCK